MLERRREERQEARRVYCWSCIVHSCFVQRFSGGSLLPFLISLGLRSGARNSLHTLPTSDRRLCLLADLDLLLHSQDLLCINDSYAHDPSKEPAPLLALALVVSKLPTNAAASETSVFSRKQ